MEHEEKSRFDEKNFLTYGLPSLQELNEIRKNFEESVDPQDNKASLVFFRLFMPCVGNKKNYVNQMHLKKLSEIFTPSQEGYVRLELINNWKRWSYQANKKFNPDYVPNKDEVEPSTEYTRSKYYSTMDGWSADGILCYNMLCKSVVEDRKHENASKFENYFHMKMQEAKGMLFEENSLSKRDPVVVPYSDLVPFEGNVYEV